MRDGKPADTPKENSELAPAPAPGASGTSGTSALFELDVPLAPRRPAPAAPAKAEGSAQSATDWMFELDTPVRATAKDIELEVEAELQPPPPAVPADPSVPPAPLPPVVDPSDIPGLSAEMARVAEPLPARDATPDGQRELRLDRLALRIQVCRDALRILGAMELKDEERKPAARALLQLGSTVLGPDLGQKLVKEPDTTLASATDEQLDALERALTQIEDKLLLLDELVPADLFRTRIEQGKHAKKALARYARLLASRPFPASERRNRFEWIATLLLAKTDPSSGMGSALPPARARQVLDVLVGGLARDVNGQELGEALGFVRDSLRRLQRISSHDEFFDSEFYLDVHGYKITMRDQLVVPEFVYLSVLLNVHVRNSVEHWIQERERLFSSNQVRGEGDPRGEILRRMRYQEESVEDALGFKRRTRPQLAPVEAAAPKPGKPAPAKRKSRPRFAISLDRNLAVLAACGLLVLGSAGLLAFRTGAVGAPTIEALSVEKLELLSPLLARGWIVGEGDARSLRANVHVDLWKQLDPRARRTEADRLSKILHSRGVRNADISDDSRVIIAIKDGFVAEVSGGKI